MNKTRMIHCFDAGPADAVARGGFERRFHYWRGHSAGRHIFTVYAADDAPDCDDAIVVLARSTPQGLVPVFVGLSDYLDLAALAQEKGADTVHLHFLARDHQARMDLLADLASPVDAARHSMAASLCNVLSVRPSASMADTVFFT